MAPLPEADTTKFCVVLMDGDHHWFADRTLVEIFLASNPLAFELRDAQEYKVLRRKEADGASSSSDAGC